MRLGLALAGLLIVLTGCGGQDQRAPFADSRIPPALGPRFWAPEGWGWGLIGVGDAPVQRYGVAASATTPKASILILTGYDETAETWFETARDLTGKGYAVWVLERAGQGGSERYVSPRDLGHLPTLDDDVAATRALTRAIVAGAPDRPLVLMGAAEGGLVAVLAAEKGGLPVEGIVLSGPRLSPPPPPPQPWHQTVAGIGLGRVPTAWEYGWRREGPDAFARGLTGDRTRGAVTKAWQTANPDLRMGGDSAGRRVATWQAAKTAKADLKRIEPPVLMLIASRDRPAATLGRACESLPACEAKLLPDARPALHLERDSIRAPWLSAVETFLAARTEARRATQQTAPDHRL